MNLMKWVSVKLTEKEKKFDYLYNVLPIDRVIKTNLIILQHETWEKVSSYRIEINQTFSQLIRRKN